MRTADRLLMMAGRWFWDVLRMSSQAGSIRRSGLQGPKLLNQREGWPDAVMRCAAVSSRTHLIEAEEVAERSTDAALAGEREGSYWPTAARQRALSAHCQQPPRSWLHTSDADDQISKDSFLSGARGSFHKRGFHCTPALAAKNKKTSTGPGQTEEKKKKVNNKASHKKQKRAEDKARLNEWRDWSNGQSSANQGFTFVFGGGEGFYTFESFSASHRTRARQSRRDHTQWFASWASQGSRRRSKSWDDTDRFQDFFDRLAWEEQFTWDQPEEEEDKTSQQQRARKSRTRTRSSASEATENEYSCPHRSCLGLPQSGQLTAAAVKEAFRKQALRWHPDRHMEVGSKADAEKKFKEAVSAYDVLKGRVYC